MQNAGCLGILHSAFRLMVLFLFLSHLGLGIVFTLVFVAREAGVKFFRFNAGLAAILLVIALAFLFRILDSPHPPRGGAFSVGAFGLTLSIGALVISTAAVTVYCATVGRV